MSKLTRESIEKAEKLLNKKQGYMEELDKQEIQNRISRAASLDSELRKLKDAVKEKRLDIEENARALARLARKAKRSAETVEAANKANAKATKQSLSAKPKRKSAPRKKAAVKGATAESAPPKTAPGA
ncbi:MAG: hypothetical protein ABSF43_05005 [Rectinemataceae bacterium]|jgi:hypothetical protein